MHLLSYKYVIYEMLVYHYKRGCFHCLFIAFIVFSKLEVIAQRPTWEDEVLAMLANGYNVHYGARSIKYKVSTVNKLND